MVHFLHCYETKGRDYLSKEVLLRIKVGNTVNILLLFFYMEENSDGLMSEICNSSFCLTNILAYTILPRLLGVTYLQEQALAITQTGGGGCRELEKD